VIGFAVAVGLFGVLYTAFRMISLDDRIFAALEPVVHTWWGGWTGKTNFALTRVLVGLFVGSLVVNFFARSPDIVGLVLMLIAATMLSSWAFLPPNGTREPRLYMVVGMVSRVEQLVDGAEEDDALPAELLRIEEREAGLRRWGLAFFSYVVLFETVNTGVDVLYLLPNLVMLLLPHYTLFHYEKGGKSKIKEKVVALFAEPVPEPAPDRAQS